ncbi:subtilisin inhibitor CLSI-I isoform X1 [Cucumis sativus]|uniref:subtilisin inhibitor CLSI-I isoform X1 n=1 Tax=Cucumis sativus TaxID=3659 RepID=UPI0012F50593|nr:subtilisin inhibitor CLSI-I isoform X1 [Cucumis sativus]
MTFIALDFGFWLYSFSEWVKITKRARPLNIRRWVNQQPPSFLELMQLFQPEPPENKVWPSLVGLTAEEAEKKIKEEMPEVYVTVVPPNHAITFDLRFNRVWLFVDSSGKVRQTPSIG